MIDLQFVQIIPFVVGVALSLLILSRMRLFSSSGMFFRDINEVSHPDTDIAIVEIGGLAIFPILLISLCPSLGVPKWLGYDAISASDVEQSGLRIMQVIAGCALLYTTFACAQVAGFEVIGSLRFQVLRLLGRFAFRF